MNFRIRYREDRAPAEREAVVEANTPTEALVKFCHARGREPVSRVAEKVTSISADEPGVDCGW